MILADLHDGKRLWKRETRTYSFTSGPRSPTKMEYSGPRSSRLERSEYKNDPDRQKTVDSYLRSARPPPVAQFSLKTRLVLGMGVPFRERALAAAAGEEKSTKQ